MGGWLLAVALLAGCGRLGFEPMGDGGTVPGDGDGDASDGGLPGVEAQVAYLKANQINLDDSFGISVAISTTGTTLAIGADGENSIASGINGDATDMSAQNAGAAYVFVRTGAAWQQQAYVKPSNTGGGDRFGTTVALSGDGNTLAVGAVLEDGLGIDAGAVYVFRRSGTTWSEEARIKASNGSTDDRFGIAIALSVDGGTLAVGAHLEDSPGEGATDSGAVYVFVRAGTTWGQEAYVKASNAEAGDEFGVAVALSDDGNTLVAGSRDESSAATGINGDGGNNGSPGSGAVYVFTRSGTAWTQQAYVKASNTGNGDAFGYSVALSGDGATLAVAAEDEASPSAGVGGDQGSDALFGAGAVYVLTRAGTVWSQQEYIKATNPSVMDSFGWNVSLSGTGDLLAVASWREDSRASGLNGDGSDNSLTDSGALWTYRRTGTTWAPQAYVKASNTAAVDRFASAIALSRDGTTIIAGAPTEDSNGVETNDLISDSGACYVFE